MNSFTPQPATTPFPVVTDAQLALLRQIRARKAGSVQSEAKSRASTRRMNEYWRKVRAGELPAPRRSFPHPWKAKPLGVGNEPPTEI